MSDRIQGKVLLGFGDFFEGVHIGVTKSAPKPSAKPGPVVKGKGAFKTAVDTTHSPHKKAIVSTINAGKKALNAGKNAAKHVADYKPSAHAPLIPVVAKMHVGGLVTIGVAPVVARVLTPAQKQAVDKHTNTIARQAIAVRRLDALVKKANMKGKDALDFAKKTAPFLKGALGGGKAQHLLGLIESGAVDLNDLEDHEVVDLCEMLGIGEEIGADAAGISPGQPGYDPTSDPSSPTYVDPNVSPTDPNVDPSLSGTGVVTAPDGTVLYDPATDPSIVPMPTRDGVLSKADSSAIWQKVPDDGIVYSGGFGDRDKGSFGFWNGPKNPHGEQYGGAAGMVFGGGDGLWGGNTTPRWIGIDGQKGGADITKIFAETSTFVLMPLAISDWFSQGNDIWDDKSYTDDKAAWAHSQKTNQGPLIGNPTKPAVASLQYAVADDKWFWQGKNAPSSAAAEADAKITLANQKTIAANTAAAQVQAAQMVKDAAAQAEAQAKQEAAQALAQTDAEAEKTVAQTKAEAADITATQAQEAQKATADIEYQKSQDVIEAQKATADIEASKIQAQTEAEAAHALIEEANIHNEWLRQHPEAMQQVKDAQTTPAMPEEEELSADEGPSMFEEKEQSAYDDSDEV